MSVLINFKICDNAEVCGGIEVCPTGALSWDEENEEWYFSIVDVIAPLTMSLGLRRHGSRCIFV